MNLNVSEWKEFFISRNNSHSGLFDIYPCKCKNAGDLDDGNDLNYIGAKKSDNGVMKRVKIVPQLVSKGNGILFICDGEGSVGYTNYIDCDFIGSTTVSVGYDKKLNALNAMFLVSILDKEKYKFSYGRKYRQHLDEISIKLPICKDTNGQPIIDNTHKYSEQGYIPDFKFMEDYIKSLHYKPITTKNKPLTKKYLDTTNWKDFRVGKMFEVSKAFAYNKETFPEVQGQNINTIKCITRTAQNNGCDYYGYITPDLKIEKGNCLTIGGEGIICFYQPKDFVCGTNMSVLRLNELNNINGLFLATIINHYSSGRFNYGRAFNKGQIEKSLISLPICLEKDKITPIIDTTHKYSDEGYIPDFRLMEEYIMTLPLGDILFKNNNRQTVYITIIPLFHILKKIDFGSKLSLI